MFGSTKHFGLFICFLSQFIYFSTPSILNLFRYDSDNTTVTWTKWSSTGCTHNYNNFCEHNDTGPQPNNYLGDQRCVAMRWNPQMQDDATDFEYSTWYDESCSYREGMGTVCEYEEKMSTLLPLKTSTKGLNISPISAVIFEGCIVIWVENTYESQIL